MIIINLIGSSGSGKTTTALGLAYSLKLLNYKVEYVSEWIKDELFKGNTDVVKDQLFITANQASKLNCLIGKGLDFIVVDSPLILGYLYGQKYNSSCLELDNLILHEFNKIQSINYFLHLRDTFDSIARLEKEFESKQDSINFRSILNDLNITYTNIDGDNYVSSILDDLKNKGY